MEMFGKNLRRSKKGSLVDIVFIGVVLTVFSILVLIGLKIATEVEDNIDANPLFTGTEAASEIEEVRVKYTNTIDNTFFFLMIFVALAVLVLAALVRIHPMFIPFYFIGWVIVIFLSGIFSNMYQAMAADANLEAVAAELTFISSVMTALPIIVGIFGIILMAIMYKLWTASQQ